MADNTTNPRKLFVFRFHFCGNKQGLHSPILIVAEHLAEANELVKKEGNELAAENKQGTGYKCVQEIILNKSMNLNLEIK